MEKISYKTQTSLLMRVNSTQNVKKWYETNTLQFGCAANWIDYAFKEKDHSTGDFFECVFAHIMKNDPRIDKITDIKGNPIGDNLFISVNKTDDSCLLRFEPTILMPVLCLYSFNVPTIVGTRGSNSQKATWFAFDLDKYREAMRYKENDSSYLFITNTAAFFEDLRYAIPKAVRYNQENLTSSRFLGQFNPNEPFFCKDINYHRHQKTELFFDQPEVFQDLFWKLPEYKWQSELRIVIPNTNFKQAYDPDNQPYDYKKNILTVELPNFQKYVYIVPANEAHSLLFSHFVSNGNEFNFRVCRPTAVDIHNDLLNDQDCIAFL